MHVSYDENNVVEWRTSDAKSVAGKKTFTTKHTVLSGDPLFANLKDSSALYPYTVTVDVTDNELVLDIGSGYGYSAAIIAHLAEAVVALESEDKHANEMQNALIDHGIDNVIVERGSLFDGAASHSPYDVIFIQGGIELVPNEILAQLKEGGRIVVIFMQGSLGSVKIGYKLNNEVSWRFAFNAGAPVLDGFKKEMTFTF